MPPLKIIREGFKKNINYFHGIFHGRGGTPQSVKIIIFLEKSIAGGKNLETLQNGLNHEKNNNFVLPN